MMDTDDGTFSSQLAPLWTSELDPLFWSAARIDRESAWVTHIPFAHWIVTATRPRSIVELGTESGMSYSAFCEAVQRAKLDCRCLAVDTWRGDEHTGAYGEEIYADLRRFHDARYASFSELMRCTFDEALPYVPDNSIDLLHIDGLHTYDAVRHDFENWRPKLSERAVVLFHDTNVRGREFGVWRLWAEIGREYPAFEFLHGHGLGVLAVGHSSSEAIRALTHLSESSANTVRERFAFLGERWQGEMQAGLLGAKHAEQLEVLERLRHQQAERANTLEAELVRVHAAEAERAARLEADAAEREARQRGRAEVAEADLTIAQAELNRPQAVAPEPAAVLAVGLPDPSNAELEAARHQVRVLSSELEAVRNSTSWRATGALRRGGQVLPLPLRRLVRRGLRVLWWAASLQLFERLRARRMDIARSGLVAASPVFVPAAPTVPEPDVAQFVDPLPELAPTPAAPAPEPPPTLEALFGRRFPDLSPLPVFAAPFSGGRRLTIVTDSINSGSLYGGVGTALIFGALAAERLGAGLRLVTRTERPNVANVTAVLELHGIFWNGNIEFLFAPIDGAPGSCDIPAATEDVFLTTSWWTTWSTRQAVPRSRIAYLLQEDERMFYPLGDEYLRCAETLADPGLLYLVNSGLLLEHLRDDGLAPGATSFEPSFPGHVYHADSPGPGPVGGKRGFFFYARPQHARNLYWRGLEALCAAIEEGVFHADDWDFHFAGQGAGLLSLPRGARALFPGPMPWADYASFVRRMEVGLCLMYTPHPSYPPLDLAASGAVVVTNRFGNKRDLDRYSANILCVDPDVPSLVAALRDASALAASPDARAANLARSGLQRDWSVSMAPALDRLAAWVGG